MARYRLGDICTIISGSTPKTEVAEYWDGGFKWITPAELNDDSYIIEDSARKLTALGVQKTGLTPFPAGTIILSSRAPIGKVAIAGCEMYCNQGFKNLICSEIVHNKYLFWYLKGNTEYLNSLGRGATFKEISKQIVGGIEIELPPMEEQIAIAQRFEQLNLLLHERKQEITMLDQLIKARFVEMFGYPVSKQGQNEKLSDTGKVYTGSTPSMKVPEYYERNDIPFIKPGDIAESGVTLVHDTASFISDKGRDVARVMPQGSVLVTCIGTIGKVGITAKESCCNQQINFIIPNERHNPFYLAYCLTFFKDVLADMANAPVVPIINKSQFSALEIPVMPKNEQDRFAAFVSQVDKSKLSIQASLDQLETLKQSLMQKYFG